MPTVVSLAVTIVLWASAFVGIRVGVRSYGPGELALFRYLVTSAVLWLLAARNPRVRALLQDRRSLFAVALCGIAGVAVYHVLLNWGERTVPSAEASFLVNLGPIFTALLAFAFLEERFGWTARTGSAVAFAGAGLIALGGAHGLSIGAGALCIVAAAAFQGASFVLLRNALNQYGPFEVAAVSVWIGTLCLSVFLPGLVRTVPTAGLAPTLAVVYLGIFPGTLAYLCWSYVLSVMPSGKAAQFLYIVPIVTLVIGWLALSERPAFNSIVGGILVMLGVGLTRLTISQRRVRKQECT
jgi:drug/metabolite transporter (DMT)-like permease